MTPGSRTPLHTQWRPLLLAGGLVFAPLGVLLVVVGVVGLTTSVDIPHLVRDPAAVAGVPFYTGAVSHVGVIGWVATAVVCLLAAAVLTRRPSMAGRAAFLRSAGAVTSLLALDDLFMIHDGLGPNVLGIPGLWFYGVYGAATLGVFVVHRGVIWQSDYLVLAVGLAFLAGSMVFDAVHGVDLLRSVSDRAVGVGYLFEDGLKLLGIGGWFAYFARLSFLSLVAVENSDEATLATPQTLATP